MGTTKLAIAVLTIALLGSNALWLYNSVEFGVTQAYASDDAWNCHNSLSQALAVLPAASAAATPEQIIATARAAVGGGAPVRIFDGQTVVGGLAIAFDASGRITKASQHRAPAFDRHY